LADVFRGLVITGVYPSPKGPTEVHPPTPSVFPPLTRIPPCTFFVYPPRLPHQIRFPERVRRRPGLNVSIGTFCPRRLLLLWFCAPPHVVICEHHAILVPKRMSPAASLFLSPSCSLLAPTVSLAALNCSIQPRAPKSATPRVGFPSSTKFFHPLQVPGDLGIYRPQFAP